MRVALITGIFLATISGASAQEDFDSWPVLKNPFESTSGGGVMIDGYNPVVTGNRCTTDFSVKLTDGTVLQNEVEFDAVPVQGGILCTNGRWRAKDGSSNGTTPFRVFNKNGVWRASSK